MSSNNTRASTSSPTQFQHFVSVIAGEAIGATCETQKAVAHTIMNRVKEPREMWDDVECVNDVLIKSQYNAIGGREYNKCLAYLQNRDYSNQLYENLIDAVVDIYWCREADFTGGAHYIFNANTADGRSFENQLKTQPNRYVKRGPFPNINDLTYRMYRCLY